MTDTKPTAREQYEALFQKHKELSKKVEELQEEIKQLDEQMLKLCDEKEDYTVRVFAEICIDMGVSAFDPDWAKAAAEEAVQDWSFDKWDGFSQVKPLRSVVLCKSADYDEDSMRVASIYLGEPRIFKREESNEQ